MPTIGPIVLPVRGSSPATGAVVVVSPGAAVVDVVSWTVVLVVVEVVVTSPTS